MIQEIDRNKETHLKTLDELKDRAEQLQDLVKKLQREEIALPYSLVPLYEKKGNLPWPLTGRIVTHFGPSRHRRFNTITQNNGIEISPQKDTVVKAIHAGRVAYGPIHQGGQRGGPLATDTGNRTRSAVCGSLPAPRHGASARCVVPVERLARTVSNRVAPSGTKQR